LSDQSLVHLASRFLDVVFARSLTAGERDLVSGWLRSDTEADLFWSQATADQRHGLQSASAVAERLPDRIDLVRASLFHDVGKTRAGLGVLGRTTAAVVSHLGLVVSSRQSDHLRHGEIGARLLSEAGCDGVVVEFARHHHGDRPLSIEPSDWESLVAADRGWWGFRPKP